MIALGEGGAVMAAVAAYADSLGETAPLTALPDLLDRLADAALRLRAVTFGPVPEEPWWVVRFKGHWDGEFEVVQAESQVMARMAVETADDARPHLGQADMIGWIEGPFRLRPVPMEQGGGS